MKSRMRRRPLRSAHKRVQNASILFHVQDDIVTIDEEGLDFPDIGSARREAIRACGGILGDVAPAILNGNTLRVWVTDQANGNGKTLFSLNVSASHG
jgi:hypothetical protein